MKKLLFILALIVITGPIYGQYQNHYSMFSMNKYAFNPAFAGLDFSVSASLMYRNQWEGINGNPANVNLNAHLPVYSWKGAVGAVVERQSFGAISMNSISGSYNYVLGTQYGLLSIGGRGGITSISVDGSVIVTPEGQYEVIFTHNDPILLENLDTGIGGKWDFGVYFYSKSFEFGSSISNIPDNKVGLSRTKLTQPMHLNNFFQYNFKISEEVKLMQSILLRTNFSQIQTDVSSLFQINGNIFGGINLRGYSSRSLDAMAIIAGMKLGDHYTLSYSYDIGLSGIRRVNEGTHEILLNYNLRKILGSGQPPKIIYNPRYL